MTGDASGSFSGYFGGNWELDDSTGAGSLGTAMTNSSGTFSFPVTGMWLIMFQAEALVYNNSAQAECFMDITTNNSSYNSAAACAYGSS